jgi:hypothetical protein
MSDITEKEPEKRVITFLFLDKKGNPIAGREYVEIPPDAVSAHAYFVDFKLVCVRDGGFDEDQSRRTPIDDGSNRRSTQAAPRRQNKEQLGEKKKKQRKAKSIKNTNEEERALSAQIQAVLSGKDAGEIDFEKLHSHALETSRRNRLMLEHKWSVWPGDDDLLLVGAEKAARLLELKKALPGAKSGRNSARNSRRQSLAANVEEEDDLPKDPHEKKDSSESSVPKSGSKAKIFKPKQPPDEDSDGDVSVVKTTSKGVDFTVVPSVDEAITLARHSKGNLLICVDCTPDDNALFVPGVQVVTKSKPTDKRLLRTKGFSLKDGVKGSLSNVVA